MLLKQSSYFFVTMGFIFSTKSDIFSLGCVIFEMLALDTPHCDKLPDSDDDDDDDEESYDDSEYQASGHCDFLSQ
jgi:serine/threonine protein kinase